MDHVQINIHESLVISVHGSMPGFFTVCNTYHLPLFDRMFDVTLLHHQLV